MHVLLIGLSSIALADTSSVKYWYRNFDSRTSLSMLQLALNKTEDLFGPMEVRRSEEFTQGRALLLLQDKAAGQIDLIDFVPESERIRELRPIYIALEEGLVGYRVCLIRKGDEARFRGIKSVRELRDRGLVVGQGEHWPDTKVLRANDVPVETTVHYEDLYEMLLRGRFDCFLRGAHEVMEDLKRHAHLDIALEPSLVFVYPSISMFFVSRDNVSLAYRIELGLRRALLDGDFERHFQQLYAPALKQVKLNKRRSIRLNNPLLDDHLLQQSGRATFTIDGKIDH